MYGSAEPCDSGVAMGDRGLEDDSNRDGAALPQPIVERGTPSQWPPPVLAGCLRLNRDLIAGTTRCRLRPGARGNRASLGLPVSAPECGGGLFASLLALEGTSTAVRKSSRRRRVSVQRSVEVPVLLRRLQPALNNCHPARKLLMLRGEQP